MFFWTRSNIMELFVVLGFQINVNCVKLSIDDKIIEFRVDTESSVTKVVDL